MRILNAAVAAALFSFACATTGSSGWSHVSVKTVALQPGARDASGIQPVAGVNVALKCPNAQEKQLGTTASDGTLRVDADQSVPLDCSVALSQPSYKTAEFKVASLCTETAAGNCSALNVSTVLSPGAASASPGGKQ